MSSRSAPAARAFRSRRSNSRATPAATAATWAGRRKPCRRRAARAPRTRFRASRSAQAGRRAAPPPRPRPAPPPRSSPAPARRSPARRARAPTPRPAEQQRTFSSRACSLGCAVGTQVSKVGVRNVTLGVLNVLLPLVVGAALGWALARLLPGAFSRHVGRSFFHRYLALLAGAWAGVCLGLLSQSRFCILLPRGACLRCWCTWCALLLVCVSMPVGLVAAQLLEPSTQFQSLGAPLSVSWLADCPWASPTEGAAAHQSPLQAPRRRAKGWTEAGKAGGALVSPLASDRSGSVAVHLSQSLHRPGLVEIRVQVGAPPCHTPHSCLRCLAVKPNS